MFPFVASNSACFVPQASIYTPQAYSAYNYGCPSIYQQPQYPQYQQTGLFGNLFGNNNVLLQLGLGALLGYFLKGSNDTQPQGTPKEASLYDTRYGHWELTNKNDPNSKRTFVRDVQGHWEADRKNPNAPAHYVPDAPAITEIPATPSTHSFAAPKAVYSNLTIPSELARRGAVRVPTDLAGLAKAKPPAGYNPITIPGPNGNKVAATSPSKPVPPAGYVPTTTPNADIKALNSSAASNKISKPEDAALEPAFGVKKLAEEPKKLSLEEQLQRDALEVPDFIKKLEAEAQAVKQNETPAAPAEPKPATTEAKPEQKPAESPAKKTEDKAAKTAAAPAKHKGGHHKGTSLPKAAHEAALSAERAKSKANAKAGTNHSSLGKKAKKTAAPTVSETPSDKVVEEVKRLVKEKEELKRELQVAKSGGFDATKSIPGRVPQNDQ